MAQILVVDDSPSIRDIVSTMLTAQGHQTTDAADGEIALRQAQQQKYDVVITDLNMPVMDGIELVKSLRNLPEYQYTPLLLLTTESSSEKRIKGKQAGATGWLMKPFNPEKLLTTISRILD